jgi:hypothetical protein
MRGKRMIGGLALVGVLVLADCAGRSAAPSLASRTLVELSRQVDSSVTNRRRADEARDVTKRMAKEIKKLDAAFARAGVDMARINRDYDATREDFDRVLEELDETRQRSSEQLVVLIADLRRAMSEQEWNQACDGMSAFRDSLSRK